MENSEIRYGSEDKNINIRVQMLSAMSLQNYYKYVLLSEKVLYQQKGQPPDCLLSNLSKYQI